MNTKNDSSQIKRVVHPAKISSYLALEKKDLIIVSISGVLYNVGMILGPYFEGQMAQCLFDIYKEKSTFRDMALLALIYVISIAFVQAMRAVKRFFVRHFSNNTSLNMRHVIYHSMLHAERGAGTSEAGSKAGAKTDADSKAGSITDASSKAKGDSAAEAKKEISSGVDVGTLMTKAVEDVDACAEGMRKFITEIFDTGVVMIAYLAMLIYYDWHLTIISVLFSPIAYFIADRLKKPVTVASAEQKESAGRLNSSTLDRISNALTYRIYGVEKMHEEKYEERLSDYEKKSVRANIFQSSLQPIYLVISMLGVIPILIFGGKNVLGTGWTAWDIAAFTAFFSCFSKLAKKSSHAANLFNAVQKAEVSWKRIEPIMKEAENDTGEPENHFYCSDFHLRFEDVTIYKENDEPLISNISFSVPSDSIIGITGKVASGKSMLGKAIINDAEYQGKIICKDIHNNSEILSDSITTYMGHEPELLTGTIAENVSLGEDIDVVNFLADAEFMPDLKEMSDGINTEIGASGHELSGGQRQRIALARTLAHAKNIIVLDDPFSAVDLHTEDKLFQNIQKYRKNRIIFIISHRLKHFPEMDNIIFLENGKAVLSKYDELIRENSAYRELFEKQTNTNNTVDFDSPKAENNVQLNAGKTDKIFSKKKETGEAGNARKEGA